MLSAPSATIFERIEICPYQPTWRDEFEGVARQLKAAFTPSAQFHHIGSTAVPGLAAKDIIDIQVSVAALSEIDVARLEALGFVERPVSSDHMPAGRTLDQDALRKRMFRGGTRPTNLHVRVKGRFNTRYALLCRDYSRHHPVTSASYALIKERLAMWFPDDVDRYYDIKDPLFDILMEGAESWAQQSRWSIPAPDIDAADGSGQSPRNVHGF